MDARRCSGVVRFIRQLRERRPGSIPSYAVELNTSATPSRSEVVQLLSFDFMGVYDYESLSLGRVEPKRGEGQSGLLTVRPCSGED